MESSTIEETISTDSSTLPPPPPPPLRRMGRGGSVVLDPPDSSADDSIRRLPSSQFKGVVPQPNGRWGAQIYEKHQRIWLGTFSLESAAARAYDSAALRFRGRDAATNFPLSDSAASAELRFFSSHSKSEIVDMLRKHTYADELRSCTNLKEPNQIVNQPVGSERETLFDKTVTPSDVGKLNRLVIPKQHAEKHFPVQIGNDQISSGSKGVLLNLEDGGGKVWRFRYSYWNSSQSYVLTKGWSRFVKEKGLRAGDLVRFERSTGPDRQLYVDYKPRTGVVPVPVVRLFGVNIGEVDGSDGKRRRDMELAAPPQEFSKRQCRRRDSM